MKKPKPTPQPKNVVRENRAPDSYRQAGFIAAITAIVTVIVTAIITWLITPAINPINANEPNSISDPHSYSFTFQGRTVTGQSSNPFERAQGYDARVEGCELHGIENIVSVVSCYLTVRLTANMTISNSQNPTTAVYEDGSFASICCMYIGDNPPIPLYRIGLPHGSLTRRTFQRGAEIHILLDIPNPDPSRNLDAISFSPGEGVPAMLFPLRGNLTERVISSEVINAHRDDPEMQNIIRDSMEFRNDLIIQSRINEGLTYPQNK